MGVGRTSRRLGGRAGAGILGGALGLAAAAQAAETAPGLHAHNAVGFAVLIGLTIFATILSLLYLRERARWTRREHTLTTELAGAARRPRPADLLLGSEPQVVVTWDSRGEPRIEGDVGITADGRGRARPAGCSPSGPGSYPPTPPPSMPRSRPCAGAASASAAPSTPSRAAPSRRRARRSAARRCCACANSPASGANWSSCAPPWRRRATGCRRSPPPRRDFPSRSGAGAATGAWPGPTPPTSPPRRPATSPMRCGRAPSCSSAPPARRPSAAAPAAPATRSGSRPWWRGPPHPRRHRGRDRIRHRRHRGRRLGARERARRPAAPDGRQRPHPRPIAHRRRDVRRAPAADLPQRRLSPALGPRSRLPGEPAPRRRDPRHPAQRPEIARAGGFPQLEGRGLAAYRPRRRSRTGGTCPTGGRCASWPTRTRKGG